MKKQVLHRAGQVGYKHMRPHWYMLYYESCPVCGSTKHWRVRQYTPKPVDPMDCVKVDSQAYDNCQDYPEVGYL